MAIIEIEQLDFIIAKELGTDKSDVVEKNVVNLRGFAIIKTRQHFWQQKINKLN